MNRLFQSLAVWATLVCTSCSHTNPSTEQNQTVTPMTSSTKNLVSIIEIPTRDLKRAINFYSTILDLPIEEAEMGDVKMGVFPTSEGLVNVVLVHGSDYEPTPNGSVLYLNGGDDLQHILTRIEPNGGKVIVPKTAIAPEMGFFALFIDTEGNKIGLHSSD